MRTWTGLASRVATAAFGPAARRAAAKDDRLRELLAKAQLPVLAETYVALAWAATLLGGLVGVAAGGANLALAVARGAPVGPAAATALVAAFLAAGAVYSVFALYPDWRAHRRRRTIDEDLSAAVGYMAAMSAAGVLPAAIFRDLADQPLYREVANEARWIARDMDLLGADLGSALERGIRRTPSPRMEELLQGARTTLEAGGDLRAYFLEKAEAFLVEDRQRTKEYLEGLGLLGETYVTVVIAGPLFLLVMLSVMVLFGSGAGGALLFAFGLTFVLLPLGHVAFLAAVRGLGGEA